MTSIGVIKYEFSKWLEKNQLPDQGLRVTTIQHFFRDIRIKLVLAMSEAGAPPEAIRAKGISENMVRKYYRNRRLAEAVMKNDELEV